MKYKINTEAFGSGRIIQELSSVDNNDQITRLSRWILDTRKKTARQALLKLGWTPPEKVVEDSQAQSVRCPNCGESEPVYHCESCGHNWPVT